MSQLTIHPCSTGKNTSILETKAGSYILTGLRKCPIHFGARTKNMVTQIRNLLVFINKRPNEHLYQITWGAGRVYNIFYF
jgi:hypothetical protein